MGELRFNRVLLDAFEIDATIHTQLRQTLSRFVGDCFTANIHDGDFILSAVDSLAGGLFANRLPRYTHAILNPPYKKIGSQSQHRLALRRAGIETVNLYSAFVALAVALAAPGGQIVAIIPRSFCNGPYYRPFREFLLARAAIHHLHLFESRSKSLNEYLAQRQTLIIRYAKERELHRIPVKITPDSEISLSPGEHSELIRAIIEEFSPRFAPGSVLVYAGDTGEKWGYFDSQRLHQLGIDVAFHGKMPDVVLHYTEKNWLLLIESVTSHGPVDGKRHDELTRLFANSTAGLVFVTAFPNRSYLGRYLAEIAWETEVWIADSPSHLIHFNGERFLGPYPASD